MKNLSTWMLGGALAASLTWNWNLVARERAGTQASVEQEACVEPATCRDRAACSGRIPQPGDPSPGDGAAYASLDTTELGLDARQEKALGALCASSCGPADDLERRANELQSRLVESLARPEVDLDVARSTVREVAELRRRALEACVEGILAVRGVLTPAQVDALLGGCSASPSAHGRTE